MSVDITGLGAIASAAKGIADKFWPDKTEIEKAKIAADLQDTMNSYNLAAGQIDINKIEAASTNWFVAGWRPAVGWTCAGGLFYQFLFMPILNGLINAIWHITPFISLDIATLVVCLGNLLGIGALRTYEKKTGSEANR